MKPYFIMGIALLLAGCLTIPLVERYNPGKYEGSGAGYYGTITVAVETDTYSIVDIAIVEQHEDEFIGLEAMRELSQRILEEDSTDIDAITGATISSNGFLDAVNNALRKGAAD